MRPSISCARLRGSLGAIEQGGGLGRAYGQPDEDPLAVAERSEMDARVKGAVDIGVVVLVFMVVGVLGSGGQRDSNDNGSL